MPGGELFHVDDFAVVVPGGLTVGPLVGPLVGPGSGLFALI